MHPWEDYRRSYAARDDLGGGVLLTLSHPFDYLRWLVGEVESVAAVEARQGVLGLSVGSCVDVNLRFASGASGHVHVDFVRRPTEHRVEIVGTEGTVVWNQEDHAARRYRPASGSWDTVRAPEGFERNHMFLEEMRHFLACLRGEASPICTLADGVAALTVALRAQEACARVSA
jgi:predicted dehydrogenase